MDSSPWSHKESDRNELMGTYTAVQQVTLKVSSLTLYQVLGIRNPRQLSWVVLVHCSSEGLTGAGGSAPKAAGTHF